MTDTHQKKSLRDYLMGAKNKVSKKFRVSYTYMDLKTHQDVVATDKSSALKAAKRELLDPKYMKGVVVQELHENANRHWNQHSKKIIDAAINLIAKQKTAAQRRNAIMKVADDNKVSYGDLYSAITCKTGTELFTHDDKK